MSRKKININVICIFLMFINLYFAGMVLGKIGIIRDEYGITGKDELLSTGNEIIIFYLPIIIIILNFILLCCKSMKKQVLVFLSLISVCAIIFSSVLTIKISYNVNNYQPKYIEMEELKLNSLQDFFKSKESGAVYIKRNDCAQCNEMDEIISKIITNRNVKVYFYSTSEDRDNNADEMYGFLDSIKVSYVPVLLECEEGKILNYYSLDNEEELRKFLKNL